MHAGLGGDVAEVGDGAVDARLSIDQPAKCVARVPVKHREGDEAGDGPDDPLRRDLGEEDALEPDLPEPEPIRQPRRQGRDEDEEEEEREREDREESRRAERAPAPRSARRRWGPNAGRLQAADEVIVVGNECGHGSTYAPSGQGPWLGRRITGPTSCIRTLALPRRNRWARGELPRYVWWSEWFTRRRGRAENCLLLARSLTASQQRERGFRG